MTTDIIYTVEENGRQYPFFGRAKFDRAMHFIGDQFPDFTSFAEASLTGIFSTDLIDAALHYQVDTFASSIFLNDGNGSFEVEELPEEAQVAPVKSIIVNDLNEDGYLDIILAGNIYEIHPDVARSDAGNGLLMYGDGNGGFVPAPAFESGLYIPGNVKDLKFIDTPDGRILIIANNGNLLKVLKINSD
jgi:hypothetical protein